MLLIRHACECYKINNKQFRTNLYKLASLTDSCPAKQKRPSDRVKHLVFCGVVVSSVAKDGMTRPHACLLYRFGSVLAIACVMTAVDVGGCATG